MEKQIEVLQEKHRQAVSAKGRLERQMDNLDDTDPFYNKKISDLQRRYDDQYVSTYELEKQINALHQQISTIRSEKISGENVYQLLYAFDAVYASATEIERKEFMRAFIERIDLFSEKREDGCWIKNIVFNFPVPINGQEVDMLPLENQNMLETVCLLAKS